MAEESVSLPGSPDVSKYWRRISTGRLNLLYTEEKVLPNYLRASTGSCHDLCKYGKRYESEEKARGSTLKKLAVKLNQDKILSRSLDSPLRNKTLAKTALKPSWSSGKCESGGSNVKREVAKFSHRADDVRKVEASTGKSPEGLSSVKTKNFPEKMKKKTASFSKSRLANSIVRKQVSPTFKTVGVSPVRASSKSKEITECNKRAVASKPKSTPEKASAVLRSRNESDSTARKKIGVYKADSKKPVVPARASALLSQKRLPGRSGNLKAKNGSSLNVVPSMKSRKEARTTKAEKSGNEPKPEEESKDSAEEKTLYVIKMETENQVVESAKNERCVVDSPNADSSSSSPQNLTSAVPSPESPSSSNGEKNQEKSESNVTEAEDGGAATEVQEKSEGTVTEAEDDSFENSEKSDFTVTEEEDDDESLSEGMNTPSQRKNRTFSSKDAAEDKAVKLHFKRGKIVDGQSQDNSPRRLKFKRGRVVSGDDTTPKSVGRRSFKTKGTNFNADEHKPRSAKVVLRHQDTQGKKDSQGLFNNVIEETANKLVETRKSKVKALVGAFETVISLQERKPSANN